MTGNGSRPVEGHLGIVWCAILVGILAVSGIGALGTADSGDDVVERRVITGVVRRVGSEPLTNVVVTEDDTDYIVPADTEPLFEKHLGMSVEVEAGVRLDELETVDGSFTVTRRYLVDPVILEES
ncbi:MAG: hypothetical protein ACOCV0_02385 [Alkalispirochaeta sp.]